MTNVGEGSESEEDEDEAPDDIPLRPVAACMRARASVSAEAFGEWNQRGHVLPPVHHKPPEQMLELTTILSKSFLFSALDAKDLETCVLAMQGPINLEPGRQIITEGDPGDHLYVITDGFLECLKVINGERTLVKTCAKGDLFGELALLYNSPRAASVVSKDASTVWELDRQTFNSIVMDSVQRKRNQCSVVLRKIPLLQAMSDTEVDTIIDALKIERRQQGDAVIRQNEVGDRFYIVYEGQAVATKVSPDGSETAMAHEAGDYFGELALLSDTVQPRAATVVVTSPEVCLLSMDRSTFKRLMGPAEDFLQRGIARYG